MTNTYAVVLAAGQGTRMKSDLYKVLHPVCGKSMVAHVIDNIINIGATRIVTIVGHGAEKVTSTLGEKSEYALQEEQLGTAHAVQQAEELLGDLDGTTIVVCGDTPLIRSETMKSLIAHHNAIGAKATILTAIADDPTGYGRIIRGAENQVLRNVEHKDSTPDELEVKEINTGTYCFSNRVLFETLKKVKNDNAQGEYYLPDVIGILQAEGSLVSAYIVDDFSETLGINDRVVLSQAEAVMRRRIVEDHMRNGVTVINPENTYISTDAVIGRDTILQPGTMIEGHTVIGERCTIGPNSQLVDSVLENEVTIHSSVILKSKIGANTTVGPFAHIRPDTELGDGVRIGNFVELKKSIVGNNSKISHLSYIGDTDIGTQVNIGCGAITVNYDGKNKYKTTIEDDVFIGCNVNLIAPVTVQEGSFVAAGSTISKDVPKNALAIGRARQENKEDYVTKLNLKPKTKNQLTRGSVMANDYPNHKLKIFSLNSNEPLAREVAEEIGRPLGQISVKRFSDGEVQINIEESIRGCDVFIIQSTSNPVNEHLMELLIMIDALKRASARTINVVNPYYGYARQDRKARSREPITAKLVANLLETAGAHRVIAVDLHAPQIQGFFDILIDHLVAEPILTEYFSKKGFDPDELVIVSPDHGGVTRARKMADRMKAPIAIIDKRRPRPNVAEVMSIVGSVEGRTAILIDDIIDTAGTITVAAEALMESGATAVYACCTHPVLSGPAIERINNSQIKELVITNSIALPPEKQSPKIVQLSIANLLARAIIRIFEEKSVSTLFD